MTKNDKKLATSGKIVYNKDRIVVIKMKKIVKMLTILLILFLMQLNMSRVFAVNAPEGDNIGPSQYSGALGGSLELYDPNKITTDLGDEEKFIEKVKIILRIIRGLGTLVSVGVLMVISIRMMISSAEEKSILKQAMPGYVLGAIMVFAMTWLPSLLYEIAGDL